MLFAALKYVNLAILWESFQKLATFWKAWNLTLLIYCQTVLTHQIVLCFSEAEKAEGHVSLAFWIMEQLQTSLRTS